MNHLPFFPHFSADTDNYFQSPGDNPEQTVPVPNSCYSTSVYSRTETFLSIFEDLPEPDPPSPK